MLDGFLENFNANDGVYKANNFDVLPIGNYTVIATKAEEKISRTNVKYLAMTYEVIEGEYKGRKLFVNFHFFSENIKAKEIAINDFRGLCFAVNVNNPKDENMLLNKPFIVKVGVVTDKQTGEKQNNIKQYIPAGGSIGNAQPIASAKAPWQN